MVDGSTFWDAALGNALQTAINGLYAATSSAYGLVVDGVGGAAVTAAAGAIQFAGRLIVKNSGTQPTIVNGPAVNSPSGNVVCSLGSTDAAGQLNIAMPASGALGANAVICTVKLVGGASRAAAPFVVITPVNPNAGNLGATQRPYVSYSGNDWQLVTGSGAAWSTGTYLFNYAVYDIA
jgi:hypothetical protein